MEWNGTDLDVHVAIVKDANFWINVCQLHLNLSLSVRGIIAAVFSPYHRSKRMSRQIWYRSNQVGRQDRALFV